MKKEKNKSEFEPISKQPEGYSSKASSKPLFANISVKIDKVIVEKVKDYAYWERLTITEIVSEALRKFLSNKTVESRLRSVKNRIR